MNDVVVLNKKESIALIQIQNSPVNALSHAVRQGLMEAVRESLEDPAIKVLAITGSGKFFSAGADIQEFGKPSLEPQLPQICNAIESCSKPVFALINGTALGGGFELALSAHFRVATASAKIGLPEIHLGLLPGSGGTQRLPRIIGADKALKMMLNGQSVSAGEGLANGVIDRVDESGDLISASMDFMLETTAGKHPRIPTRERTEGLQDEAENHVAIGEHRNTWQKKGKGLYSPFQIIDCVEKALSTPFEEGLKYERESFARCLESPQRKGLIHAFFAERRCRKIPELREIEPRKLERLAVIGGGTMGGGIAVAALDAGLEVMMVERDEAGLEKGRLNVEKVYDRHISKGRMGPEDKKEVLERFIPSTDFERITDADMVIEAVFEEMEVKKEVFRILDQYARQGAVLASNTSYLDIDEIASVTSRPEEVLGLHFFSPANIMKLLEIVVPSGLSNEVLATGFALGNRMGKVPVRSANSEGFIGNRILGAYSKVAGYMMEDGTSPYRIDEAVRDFGYPIGPFQMFDLAGGDIGWANRKRKATTRDPRERYVEIADRLCERGWFGQKTGRGFYLYEEGSRIGIEDPEVLDIIAGERSTKGIRAREYSPEEIIRRYIGAMVNEAAKVLEEKVARCPSDIDVVQHYGYGFPRYRGGPMKYADMYGIRKIVEDIEEFSVEAPFFWKPSELLKTMAAQGQTFEDLNL